MAVNIAEPLTSDVDIIDNGYGRFSLVRSNLAMSEVRENINITANEMAETADELSDSLDGAEFKILFDCFHEDLTQIVNSASILHLRVGDIPQMVKKLNQIYEEYTSGL